MPRRVMIVGATSAIAQEVLRLHLAAGDQLYLLARNPQALEALVRDTDNAQIVGHHSGDLNEVHANAERVRAGIKSLGGLDAVLIAHGYLGDQLKSQSELDEAVRIMQTNFASAISLLIPLAQYFEGQGAGHIGVITSVAGERGRPRNYTYGAAKGGLTHYLEGLRSRLVRAGVRVHNLKLGPVETPMTVGHEKNALFAQPPAVARAIFRAMQGRRFDVYVPWFWRGIMWPVRWMPEWLFQRLGFLSGP